MKACLIRLDHLGDLILTTPLLSALARGGYEVDVVASAYACPLLQHHPAVHEIFAIEEVAPGFPAKWMHLARWLRGRRYDAVLLPYARPRQLLFASALSGAGRRVAMWAGVWGRLTGHVCLRSRILQEQRHFSDICLDCGRALGLAPDDRVPRLYLSESERVAMRARLRERFGEGPVIVVHPGSGGNACNLPGPEYASFAQAILERTPCGVVVTGSAGERPALEQWFAGPVFRSGGRCWLSAGELSLRELMALVAETDLLVCSSTGPLQMASALGRRSLSPFCPFTGVNAAVWGNIGGEGIVLEQPRDRCPRCAAGTGRNCDFRGVITAQSLLAALPPGLPLRQGNA